MSEVKYESKIGQIAAKDEAVFRVLSNMENLNRVREMIPQDKVQDLEITPDCVRMKVGGLAQKIAIRIVDKEEFKTIKFGAENIPVAMNVWIQLKYMAEADTRIRITIKADIPMMFRMMVDKKIQQGLDQAVDMLCQMPFNQWQE